MGPFADLWGLQPCRPGLLRHMLHPVSGAIAAAAQVCHTVSRYLHHPPVPRAFAPVSRRLPHQYHRLPFSFPVWQPAAPHGQCGDRRLAWVLSAHDGNANAVTQIPMLLILGTLHDVSGANLAADGPSGPLSFLPPSQRSWVLSTTCTTSCRLRDSPSRRPTLGPFL